MRRTFLLTSLIVGLVAFGAAFASSARADSIAPINFEPPYVVGDINGQMGWTKLNPAFDVKVASVSAYPAAAMYHFDTQALRGARMSYLRFEDHSNGVHVFFEDVTNPGPIGTVSNFVETDIATLSRTRAHSIRFGITFKTGPGNDVVRIYIDGVEATTGTTWENYYRYDPEAAGNGNQVSPVSKLLFRESGDAHPTNAGNGFLVDNVSLDSDH